MNSIMDETCLNEFTWKKTLNGLNCISDDKMARTQHIQTSFVLREGMIHKDMIELVESEMHRI